MGHLVEEDLTFRGKINKVLGNESFVAFLSLFDFIPSLCLRAISLFEIMLKLFSVFEMF